MNLRASAQTDIGCIRQENEDSFLCDEALTLYAVADGIGGLPAGAQASRRAVDILQAWFGRHSADASPDFAAALREANDAVHQLGRQLSPRYGIGTTLSLAHFRGRQVHTMHVGDSFIFRLRGWNLDALTTEHNLESEMKALAARGEPVPHVQENRAALTRCVGQPPPLLGDFATHAIVAGDRYLLCTDGVTRCIMRDELSKHLVAADSPEAAASALVQLARTRGGVDNATAVVVFVD
jgi:protein phosphatase